VNDILRYSAERLSLSSGELTSQKKEVKLLFEEVKDEL
jgi:hypothetical protein